MADLIEEDLIIEEAPEADTAPEIIVEEPKPDTPSVDETLEALKTQLEDERRAREAAELRERTAAQQVQQANNRASESELNLVTNAIGNLENAQDQLRANLKGAFEDQDYGLVADIQAAMARNEVDLSNLRQGKQQMENAPRQKMPPADPVEALASQLSPRSADWVRRHPEYASDPRQLQRMIAAHNLATAQADTDEYFAQIEKTLGIGSTDAPPQQQSRSAPPAAPVTRSATGTGGSSNPNRVTLTAAEREMAKMMGMTDREYAQQKVAIAKEKMN